MTTIAATRGVRPVTDLPEPEWWGMVDASAPAVLESDWFGAVADLFARSDQETLATTDDRQPGRVTGLAGAAEPAPWSLPDEVLLAELSAVGAAASALRGRWLGLVAEAERRQLTLRTHSVPTASWLAAGTTHSARQARADVRLAGLLDDHAPVGDALRAGRISTEQAAAIATGLEHLPDRLDRSQVEAVAEHLVQLADEFNPPALRRLVHHAVAVVAPEVVAEHDRASLERAERSQHRNRHVGWKTDPEDGGLRFWGKLDAVNGELFKQHLAALASGQRCADAAMGVETTPGQALADSLMLCLTHHAGCAGGPVKGGDHTRVVVTLDHDALRAALGAASLVESDELVTAAQVRHLACSAGLLPLVLDGESLPLDLGRSQRLFTPAQRVVLAVRDRGCSFPGCDRPPSDCEAHHGRDPWWRSGRTDVADGVLVCPHHHHLVEPNPNLPDERNWLIDFDGRGHPVFHSPVRSNGKRVVQQHHRYRT